MNARVDTVIYFIINNTITAESVQLYFDDSIRIVMIKIAAES